jgi:hypothetical protein
MYMASGYVPSADGHNIFFYSSGQPYTHGQRAPNHTWANNTGIRILSLRRDVRRTPPRAAPPASARRDTAILHCHWLPLAAAA